MIPPPFEYRAPDSIPEALALLREYGDEARLMAGGQSLLPMLKLRLIRPRVIIDIGRLRELTGVTEDADSVRIGALVTERTLERTFLQRQPLLSEAAASIGDIHIRNLGTLGGTLSQADPSGDLAPAVLALRATLTARSAGGSRTIAAHDFFSGPFDTCLSHDEMVTSVDVPVPAGVWGHAYIKLTRRAGDYAVVGAAALVSLSPDGSCSDARVALCAVGPTAFVCEGLGPVAPWHEADGRRPGGSRRAGRKGCGSGERCPRIGRLPEADDPGGSPPGPDPGAGKSPLRLDEGPVP